MISEVEHRLLKNRLRKSVFFILNLSLIFIFTRPTADATAAAQVSKDIVTLEAGKPIERELKAGELHVYQVAPGANQFLRVIVDQRGIDVVVDLFGPDGKLIAEVDSPNGRQGPEPVSLITQAGGQYRLDIQSLDKEAPPGRYEVKIAELRPATSQDSLRITAERAFAQAQQLRAQGTAGSLQEALHKYEEALPIQRALGARREEAITLNSIGAIYDLLGEVWKALDFHNQALLANRAAGDRRGEATALHNIGAVYDFVGEKQKALGFYNQALLIKRAVGDQQAEAITLVKMGSVYNIIGEKQKALDFYNQVLVIQRTVGDRNVEAGTLDNIGAVYDSLGEKQKALDFYNQALPIRRAIGDRRGQANTLNSMGVAYTSLGEIQKALDSFNQALPLWRAVGDRRGEASTLRNLGAMYDSLGEKSKALDFYNQALPILRAVGYRSGEANTLSIMGSLYESLGEKQKALDYLNQSLSLSRTVGERNLEAKVLYSLARVKLGQNQVAAARDDIQAALEVVESLRIKIASPELRASYFASVQQFYELYISLLMRLHRSDPNQGHDALALEASERARARTLLELLAEDRADIRQGADPDLLERERALRQLIDAKSDKQARLLNSKHTDQQAVEARKELDQLLTQYQEVQARIRAKSPRYAALTQPQPLGLNRIQREVVDADTLLLEYALGDEGSYLWAVTPDSLKAFELPGRAVINNAAQRLYELLTVRNRRGQGLPSTQSQAQPSPSEVDYQQAAAELSQMILGPVASMLAKKRLLIVADGALNYVPFAALPAPAAARPGSENEYHLGANQPALQTLQPALIQEHEIINLPSASSLAVLRQHLVGRKPAPKAAAILADPVFDVDDARVKAAVKLRTPKTSSARDRQAVDSAGLPDTASQDVSRLALTRSAQEIGMNDRGDLPRLPFTRQEAEAIYAVTKRNDAMKALDFDANRETAASPDLSQYRIVHFATHGLLNNEHPELSGIVLSLFDKQGNPQNGFFRLVNVYNMNLSADLVVLSACQTALGKQVRGEGLVGLTRGFMYAGAARVVASLWKVEDEATADLMKKFYEAMMKQGQRPAAALRSAQIWMQKQKRWRSSYYWAGFVLQGEWN